VTAPGPIFIDMHGSGRGPEEPTWKRCWFGREPLWRVFWGWFICGHGALLGCAVGFMILAMILGFMASPTSIDSGMAGLATGATLLMLVFVPYSVWCIVSLWRCAYNCIDLRWGHWTRGIAVAYVAVLIVPFASKFM